MARPPRIPNWLPTDQSTVYFLTFCVGRRQTVLANVECWNACLDVLTRLDCWKQIAVMLMPDHIHLLSTPAKRDASVSAFSKWFKRWFHERVRPDWVWQEGCFDRLLRSDESAQQKWEYIRYNPVRAGLVEKPEEWPYQKVIGLLQGVIVRRPTDHSTQVGG